MFLGTIKSFQFKSIIRKKMEIALTPTEIRVKISFHSAQSEENHSKRMKGRLLRVKAATNKQLEFQLAFVSR